jgi:glutaredoxin 3
MKNIEIFTWPGCAHCETAKAPLTKHGLAFKDHDISDVSVMDEFRLRLPRECSIPQIFVDGEHLGNDEDLRLKLEKELRVSVSPLEKTDAQSRVLNFAEQPEPAIETAK